MAPWHIEYQEQHATLPDGGGQVIFRDKDDVFHQHALLLESLETLQRTTIDNWSPQEIEGFIVKEVIEGQELELLRLPKYVATRLIVSIIPNVIDYPEHADTLFCYYAGYYRGKATGQSEPLNHDEPAGLKVVHTKE